MTDAALILWEILSEFLVLIDELLCIVLTLLFSGLKIPLPSILKKLEMGVFFFCWREAIQARLDGEKFAHLLMEQAESEYSHCHFFSRLDGTELRISSDWLFNREHKALHWGRIDWGDEYQADGISHRYLCAKVFFQGRTAASFGWKDKLAFMCVLEDFQYNFYLKLSNYVYDLFPLAEAEKMHAITLEAALFSTAGDKASYLYLLKWNILKYLALFFVPIDFLIIKFKKS